MRNFSTRWMMIASLAGIGALGLSAGCGSDNGNGGTGGKTGSGSGGTSGGDAGTTPKVNYTFDSTVEGWALNTYADPSSLNLAGIYPVDGGLDGAASGVDGGAGVAAPTVTWDSATGKPGVGSLKVTVTFTGFNQYVDVAINPSPLLDLTKQPVITAEVMLTSGMFSGGGQLHASTGATFNAYGSGALSSSITTPGTWLVGKVDLSTVTVANWDDSMVAQVGIQFFSGSPVGDGGAYPNAGVPVVFNIDTVVSGAL